MKNCKEEDRVCHEGGEGGCNFKYGDQESPLCETDINRWA